MAASLKLRRVIEKGEERQGDIFKNDCADDLYVFSTAGLQREGYMQNRILVHDDGHGNNVRIMTNSEMMLTSGR